MTRTHLSILLALVALTVACRPSRPAGVADIPLPVDAGPGVIDVSQRLQRVRKARRVPSVAAAAFDSQRLLAIGAVGERKAASSTRVTIDDQWHLGSNTKPMTATLFARLIDRGVLAWDTRIGDFFTDQPIHAGWRNVTVEQLLSHRGGAPESMADSFPALWKHMVAHGLDSTNERNYVVGELLRVAPVETIGDFAYSNAGYMVAAAGVERRTKQTWEDLMTHELFEPLGMKGCGFGPPGYCLDGKDCNMPSQPLGHRTLGEDRYLPMAPGPRADNPRSLGPAATVSCDLRSWGSFLQEHLRAARKAPTSIASSETLRKMQSEISDRYGIGWGVTERRWAKGKALFNQGSNTMNYSNVWIAPALDRIYIAVTNGGSEDDFLATDDAIGELVEALD